MNCEIVPTSNFKREAKVLLKKYSSLKNELETLEKHLKLNPELGIPIGNNCCKIRLGVRSKGKGKSAGLRIITRRIIKIRIKDDSVIRLYLLKIYDKSDFESVSDYELKRMLKQIHEATDEHNALT